MYIDLGDLVWLTLISLGILFWYRSLKARERALSEAKRYCSQMDLQLLDQTIALKGIGIKRGADGWLKLVRLYQFEFSSTGDERYLGRVSMLGQRLDRIETDAHRLEG